MEKNALKWMIPGGVVLAGAALWFGLSAYAGSQAEKKLRQVLVEYDLQDQVHWGSLAATPFGTVTLKDVSADIGRNQLQAQRIVVSDVIDERDRQRARIEVTGLSDPSGHSPAILFGNSIGQATGEPELPPLDFSIKVDADYDDDRADVALSFMQDKALSGDYAMRIGRIGILRDLESQLSGSNAMGGLGIFGALAALSRISLEHLEVKIRDRGMVERAIALYKRYQIPVEPGNGKPASQRDDIFKTQAEAWEAQCLQDRYISQLDDPKQACRALVRFASGRSDTLSLTLAPSKPVSAESLYQLQSSPRQFSTLNAEIDS